MLYINFTLLLHSKNLVQICMCSICIFPNLPHLPQAITVHVLTICEERGGRGKGKQLSCRLGKPRAEFPGLPFWPTQCLQSGDQKRQANYTGAGNGCQTIDYSHTIFQFPFLITVASMCLSYILAWQIFMVVSPHIWFARELSMMLKSIYSFLF